jgi:hypothetical protein
MGSIRHPVIRCAVAVSALSLVSGCFLVVDLDRFHGPRDAGAGSTVAPKNASVASDLVVTLDDRRETGVALDIVDSRNVVVSRVIVADHDASDLVVTDVLPNDGALPYSVELFDLRDRTFLGSVALGPDARDGDRYRADFRDVHAGAFALRRGRDVGANATIEVTGLAVYPAATLFEVRVIQRSRVVGMIRSRSHGDALPLDLVVPGCIDEDDTHDVVVLVDTDGDGVVDESAD